MKVADTQTYASCVPQPIDGTTNFVHGLPLTCVSIGLALDGKMVACIVYCPTSDELFHAVRGHGAWVNGERAQVSEAQSLSESVIINEYGTVRSKAAVDRMLHCTSVALQKCRGMRQV
jgi:myo-inositol-1(or 4)-monophosphatase